MNKFTSSSFKKKTFVLQADYVFFCQAAIILERLVYDITNSQNMIFLIF